MRIAPAPLYRDPIFDGPTDPTIIYNRQEKSWWIVYTSRRANVPCHNVSWVHGTDLGIASSSDNGQSWLYRGTMNLEAIEPGRNTFWAPEILWADGCYHMFVSYITGVPDSWRGDRRILHYTSDNLWDWKFEHVVPLPSHKVIDACVHAVPGGGWRMWYKDEDHQSHTHFADSPDLFTWEHRGIATIDQEQEGPNVFTLGGKYWMIADVWDGQAVYHSDDLLNWNRQEGTIMAGAGKRKEDGNRAHHADVLVVDDHAYIFYFVHPGQKEYAYDSELGNILHRRSSVQTAELRLVDGKLVSIRDEEFDFYLPTL
ncbi:MAG: glycosyl hydrolase [Clostridia bacterium]|nr:glycosyl hydrolase [Clostridia bacterium]